MDDQAVRPQTDDVSLNVMGRLAAQFLEYGQNATSNIKQTVTTMTLQSWIRLIVIVGGYMLMRPYLLKFSAKMSMKQLDAEDAKSKAEAEADPELSPNDLRGIKSKMLDEDEQEAKNASGADWGQKARVRQRKMIQELLEEDERRRTEQEDDADIQEFLQD